MTPSTIFQALNDVQLTQQGGDTIVASATANFSGNDVLIGFSASAWASTAPTLLAIDLWIDGQPTGGRVGMLAEVASTHLSLGHAWVHVPGLASGNHELALVAGMGTVTDQNDRASVTVWDMGDGCAVRFAGAADCPSATGGTLIKQRFEAEDGQLLISAGVSGRTASPGISGAKIVLNQPSLGAMEIFQNDTTRRQVVPTDVVTSGEPRGSQLAAVVAGQGTITDGDDAVQLAVVEWVNPPDAPAVVPLSPPLQNAQAETQPGDGGSIASATFSSAGGTLLVKVGASVWTQVTGGTPLLVGIQIDGSSVGYTGIWANQSSTHMPTVVNDLVVTGVPAGDHTLNLMAEANVITDVNDRVSVLIMEFG